MNPGLWRLAAAMAERTDGGGYVLDGIETAMVEGTPCWHKDKVLCPCGFWVSLNDVQGWYPPLAALRFHYTHCPKAKCP